MWKLQQSTAAVGLVAVGSVAFSLPYAALVATAPLPNIELGRTFDRSDIVVEGSRAEGTPQALEWGTLFGTPAEPEVEATSSFASLPVSADIPFVVNGIVSQPGHQWVLIDGGIVARVGDVMPGGYVLTYVNSGTIVVERDGREVVVPSLAETRRQDALLSVNGAGESDVQHAEQDLAGSNVQRPSSQSEIALGVITPASVARAIARGGELEPLASEPDHVRINWVRPNQLYDIIGLNAGDIITALNGRTMAERQARQEAIADAATNGVMRFDILVGGSREQSVIVRIRE